VSTDPQYKYNRRLDREGDHTSSSPPRAHQQLCQGNQLEGEKRQKSIFSNAHEVRYNS